MAHFEVLFCLSSTSPQWPASFTFRAFSLAPVTPVACKPSKGRVAAMLGSCSRHFSLKSVLARVSEAILGPCWTHHEAHLNRFGAMLKNCPQKRCPQRPARSHYYLCEAFFLQNLAPAGIATMPMLAHLGPMLGPRSPILGLCCPPEVILELCCLHEFTCIPQFCLEKLSPGGLRGTHSIFATPLLWKSWILPGTGTPPMSAWRLSPVACEVPGNASRGSEEGSAASARPPIRKAKTCFSDGAAGFVPAWFHAVSPAAWDAFFTRTREDAKCSNFYRRTSKGLSLLCSWYCDLQSIYEDQLLLRLLPSACLASCCCNLQTIQPSSPRVSSCSLNCPSHKHNSFNITHHSFNIMHSTIIQPTFPASHSTITQPTSLTRISFKGFDSQFGKFICGVFRAFTW